MSNRTARNKVRDGRSAAAKDVKRSGMRRVRRAGLRPPPNAETELAVRYAAASAWKAAEIAASIGYRLTLPDLDWIIAHSDAETRKILLDDKVDLDYVLTHPSVLSAVEYGWRCGTLFGRDE